MTVRRTAKKPDPKLEPAVAKSFLPFWMTVGSLVQLVSGSFPMTVLSIKLDQPINGDTLVTCIWSAKYRSDLETKELPLACLRPHHEDADQEIPW